MALTNSVGVELGATYVIIGPDGTRAVLNDTSDPDWVGFLVGDDAVTGLERATVRENGEDLPGEDGGTNGPSLYGRLPFTLKGIVPPDGPGGTWLQRQARLMRATNAMRADARLQWTPSEAPPLEVAFRQQQPTRLTGRRPKTFLVAGVSASPYVRAQATRNVVIDSTSTGGGFGSPVRSPMASGAGPVGMADVLNGGSVDAWPVITIVGPISNPVITNLTLGRSIALTYTLAAGEELVIDTDPRRRSVLLAGVESRYSAYDFAASRWWPLVRGANTIAMSAASITAGALVIISYRDAWG